jgi:plastocyanin
MRLAPILFAGLIALSACGSSAGSAAGSANTSPAAATVQIKDYAFNPTTVTIKAGQTVQWNFADNGVAHNVIGDDNMRSSDQASGSFRHTFRRAGTFNYECSIHASMHGVVVVQ